MNEEYKKHNFHYIFKEKMDEIITCRMEITREIIYQLFGEYQDLEQQLQLCKEKVNNQTEELNRLNYEQSNTKYNKLKKQLATYKDKEDRLREYIEDLKKEKWQNNKTDYMLGMSYVGTKVLQILNEGGKE